MSIQKIKNHTYVETDFMGANVSCIDTGHGLILIDTPHMPAEMRQWKEALGRISNKDIAYVIDTHHHFDHCLGNAFFSSNVIAHQSCYEEMLKEDGTMRRYFVSDIPDMPAEMKEELYAMPLALPRITFSQRMWLHLGHANLELIHTGGHARSCIMIYDMDDKILFTGDNLLGGRHPYKGQADFSQWIQSLELMQGMDIEVIVPGHGEICDKSEIGRMLEYLNQMHQRVGQLIKQGKDRAAAIRETHDLIGYYPIDAGEEAMHESWFDEGIGRLYDQLIASLK
ncbi:MAG TPA: MBL fold metallo-hydrolase [Dehalococcoidia bacterium]|nr:MBL fold metallo-hydrolase [Dehalococcoidia bacterium]